MDATGITNATVIIGAITALIVAVREFRDTFVRAIAAILNKPELDEWWKSISPGRKRLLAVLISLALISVTYWLLPGSPKAALMASCPKNGCQSTEIVELTWRNLPAESVLCVFVYSGRDSAYFPQQIYSPGVPTGTLSANIEVGAPLDTGQDFQIGVWLADKSAQEMLLGYLNDPFRSGLGAVPAGLKIYNATMVHRR